MLLVALTQALAYEQVFVSSEVCFTLGAKHPVGFAVGAAFGEAPWRYTGFELRLGPEISFGPNGWGLSLLSRVVFGAQAQYGHPSWNYVPTLSAYTELGFTIRPSTWSGLRLGGGVHMRMVTARVHALVPFKDVQPLPSSSPARVDPAAPLPLAKPRPSNLAVYDLKLALGFEPWLLPGPLRSVYSGYY